GEVRLLVAADDADPRGRVHDDIRLEARERFVRDAVGGEVAVLATERMDLVSSLPVTQLLHERAADEARRSRDQDSHRGRVYWRACALLAVLALAGCHSSQKRGPAPPPPAPELTFRQLDAQQQRLVADYEPVSHALTAYELAYRDRRGLSAAARPFRNVVVAALARLRADRTTGETAQAKELLIEGLTARA